MCFLDVLRILSEARNLLKVTKLGPINYLTYSRRRGRKEAAGAELAILQDVEEGDIRTSAEETSREVDHASTLWRSCACSLEVGT